VGRIELCALKGLDDGQEYFVGLRHFWIKWSRQHISDLVERARCAGAEVAMEYLDVLKLERFLDGVFVV
jgi:hypothetical protein